MLFATIIIWTLLLIIKESAPFSNSYYTAAVYEHAPIDNFPKYSMSEIIAKNLMAYKNATSIAADKGADIIVFPEGTLHPEINRKLSKECAEYIPNPEHTCWNPCETITNASIAGNLSCMAKNKNIYVVANMLSFQPCEGDPDCPSDNVYIYITNVIFNRNGELVARYHKYHLYFEHTIDVPKKIEYVAFETEFATIGTFVCFDIMWKSSVELLHRYKIDAVVFPSYWIEHLPIYTSIQTMSSWSFSNNVTLLWANAQNPSIGAVGSGIFLGASGISHYVYEPNGKSKLIVADVPIRATERTTLSNQVGTIEFESTLDGNLINDINSGLCSTKVLGPPKSKFDFRCKDLDLTNFTLVKLQSDENTSSACNNGLCCTVNYNTIDMYEDYYLAVTNSSFYISNYYPICEEICMIVRCNQYNGTECATFPIKSNTTFEALTIKANITTTHMYTSVVTSGIRLLSPEKWSYANNSLSVKADEALLFAVLNGRCYDRDATYIR